jgi:hypothetical protein
MELDDRRIGDRHIGRCQGVGVSAKFLSVEREPSHKPPLGFCRRMPDCLRWPAQHRCDREAAMAEVERVFGRPPGAVTAIDPDRMELESAVHIDHDKWSRGLPRHGPRP